MRRATAVFCCLWFGLLPWQVYEEVCHYAPETWRSHLSRNLNRAWLFIRRRETAGDWAFEREKNNPPQLLRTRARYP